MDAQHAGGSARGESDGGEVGGAGSAERLRCDLDAFAAQLAAVRAGVAARASEEAARAVRLPVVGGAVAARDAGKSEPPAQAERLKLPLLRRLEKARAQALPPKDQFVTVSSMAGREALKAKFCREVEEAAAQEQAAATAIQHANQMDEQVRVAAVAFSKNERSWAFDERTRRYKDLLEARKQAESARLVAEEERREGERRRALLSDPYRDLRALPSRSTPRLHLSPLEDCEYIWLWVLASPMPTLPFTPRQETLGQIIQSEKELSTHVVYYIAPSNYNDNRRVSPDEEAINQEEDRPPTKGWICCSSHGAFPAPTVMNLKSSIETWIVEGAGAGHVNGRYILSGTHDFVRKFKSANGVEMFRKRVPSVSELAQSLYDGPAISETSPATDDSVYVEEDRQKYVATPKTPASILPSALRSIEKDEHSFQSMQRIGAWLGMNEENERYRRLKEHEYKADEVNRLEAMASDSSNVPNCHVSPAKVMVQNDKRTLSTSLPDTVNARLESCAPICKEWVLFLKCAKVNADKSDSEVTSKPKKPGLGCPYRHYYLSVEEKTGMMVWAQGKESILEKEVLSSIVARETLLDKIMKLSGECMTAYQQDLRKDTTVFLLSMMNELNQMRLTSIRVVEKIELWRHHVRSMGLIPRDGKSEHLANATATTDNATRFLLGWSVTITLSTGKQLYKGSKAFVSRVKRFCRPEDPNGMKEQHIIYLGYFRTRNEAERAYDDYAASEARRLNTTTTHLPRRRSVFRSCGKHYAVESERLGPSYCIECKAQALAVSSVDDWTPPFYYTPGDNYILKMAVDLDFLDTIPPLKSLLNDNRGNAEHEFLPLRGNAFLLPREPAYDPIVLPLTSFVPPEMTALGESIEQDDREVVLGVDRIVSAQKVLLQELALYKPGASQVEDLGEDPLGKGWNKPLPKTVHTTQASRIVETLYWDRCAALQIQQHRSPLAFREASVWCRPDAGEWSSLVARGANQLHFIFEANLAAAGKELQKKRKELLKVMRTALGLPLYLVHSRNVFTDLIAAGQALKGDVVALEVKSMLKRLATYDAWCVSCALLQRCFRGYMGRKSTKLRLKVLRQSCASRVSYFTAVHAAAHSFYEANVVAVAMRRALKKISTPIYRAVVKKDGELVVVSIHSLTHFPTRIDHNEKKHRTATSIGSSVCCRSCARRFRIKSSYGCRQQRFAVPEGVCTCSINNGGYSTGERWFIRAYNPLNNAVYRTEIGRELLVQFINGHRSAARCGPQKDVKPIEDLLHWREQALTSAVQASFVEKCALRAHKKLLSWKRLSSEAIQAKKTSTLQLENSLTMEKQTEHDHGAAIVGARKAMNFSGRKFSEAQAWDPLENANDWRLIVDKRSLEKRLEKAREETERCRVACFQATYNEQYTRVRMSSAQATYDAAWSPLIDKYRLYMESAATNETKSRMRVESAVRSLCHDFLSVRDKGTPLRRQIIVYKPLQMSTSVIRVALPEVRRQRNYLCRRVVLLKNDEKGSLRLEQRMIVSIAVTSRDTYEEKACENGELAWWVSAYNPSTSGTQEVFLEWELVQLLVRWKKSRLRRLSRSERSHIANRLLAVTMLDRFTSEFTLQKLQFYQQMRLVRPRIYASKWFQDLQRGRKSGRGDEILRQGVSIGGRLGVLVVFENWGDLSFEFYHATSGRSYELTVSLLDMAECICLKPLLLRLWISSVISNTYAKAMLKSLIKLLTFGLRHGTEMLCIKPINKHMWAKCFQAARVIDTRRVLVSIREDMTRDLCVNVFDISRCHSYSFRVEREALARIFKSNVSKLSHGSSSLQLLLRQNRKKLYEWIADHLKFQSLMGHPAALSSTISPLANGSHVRQSFSMLSDWVAARERIPVKCPTKDTINRLANVSEASAFSSLVLDQIALIPDCEMTLDRNKVSFGTLDWEGISTGAASLEIGKIFPYMKVDLYMQSHNLMVRLRKELFIEAENRRQRVAQAAMENEDWYSVFATTQEILDITHQDITQKMDSLKSAQVLVDAVVQSWATILDELRQSPRFKTNLLISINAAKTHSSLSCLPDMIKAVCPDLLASPNLFHVLRSCVNPNAVVPLPDVAAALRICYSDISGRVCNSLHHLTNELHLMGQIIDVHEKLRQLTYLRPMVVTFTRNWLVSESPQQASQLPNILSNPEESVIVEVNPVSFKSSQVNQLVDPSPEVSTALLIPDDPRLDLQEIFLGVTVSFSPRTDNTERIRTLLLGVEPIFRREYSSLSSVMLAHRRVTDGMLIYVADCNSKLRRNPRADAIVGDQVVLGLAIFVPLSVILPHEGTLWDQLLAASKVYSNILKEFDKDASDLTTSRENKKKKATTSAKLLPWKRFASDRMQVARAFKRFQAVETLVMSSQSESSRERENATIAMTIVTFRNLESMLGDIFSAKSSLDTLRDVRFAVSKERNGKDSWALVQHNDRTLYGTFSGENARKNPASCENMLRIDRDTIHVQVDSVVNPRRLLFSTRDLQSQRRYVVECGYYELVQQSEGRAVRTEIPRRPTTVQHWRTLASFAAPHLAFHKMNGSLSMFLDWTSHFDRLCDASSGDADAATTEGFIQPTPQPIVKTKNELVNLRQGDASLIGRCCAQRFSLHEQVVLRTVVLEQARCHRQQISSLPSEWVKATIEDQRSRALRGILVLDSKVLARVQRAYVAGTRKARKQQEKATGDCQLKHFQLLEICKELGTAVVTIEDIIRELEGIERDRKARHVQKADMFDSIWTVADVAEWWRRHLLEVSTTKVRS